MLLPDMTHEEIRKDLVRDLDEIKERGLKMNRRLIVRLSRLKRQNKTVAVIKHLTSKNKIKWVVLYALKPDTKNEVDISLGTFYHNKKGLRLVLIDPYDLQLQIYNSHFFRRYNERMEFELEDNIRSIFKTYIKRNGYSDMTIKVEPLKNNLVDLTTQVLDGIKLGKKNLKTNTTVWNTFISHMEVKGDQGKFRELMIQLSELVYKTGMRDNLTEYQAKMLEMFRRGEEEVQVDEAYILTEEDLIVSKEEAQRKAKEKEMAKKVLAAMTNQEFVPSKREGLFSVGGDNRKELLKEPSYRNLPEHTFVFLK